MNARRVTRVAGKAARKRARPSAECSPGGAVVVSAEQRKCLIEDLAYFHAERYRHVERGRFREQDRREAEADVTAALQRFRKR